MKDEDQHQTLKKQIQTSNLEFEFLKFAL